MKKNLFMIMITICFIIPCTLLLSACGGNELIYFDTVLPNEYEIEIEYTSEKINYVSKIIKKGNDYCGQQDPSGDAFYLEYYTLTNRTEKPYNYHQYNYVYEEWNAVKEVEKIDSPLFGGTAHPTSAHSVIFQVLDDIIDKNTTPFDKSEYIEDCIVAGRACVKYRITSSDGSSSTYSYDKENFAILEQIFIDNDGDDNNQSYTVKVTKFSTTVADNWKETFLKALPV